MTRILECSDLTVRYGKMEAVKGVNLHLEVGEIVTVIGPNGAGKTSLMSALMGLLPYGGRASFCEQDLARIEPEQRVEQGFCLVPETRELFTDMSVEDNLLLGAYTRRKDRKFLRDAFDRVYAQFPRLLERKSQLASTLSGGERQMLAIGRALMSNPRLLLLDEPSLGLAPMIVQRVLDDISNLRKSGMSVLLVEQNARAALDVADRAYVMEAGEFTLEGPASDLAKDPRVMAVYLGGDQFKPQ